MKKIKVQLVKSGIGRPKRQKSTLVGLGLNKINKISELEDTPCVRGMISRVCHLVKVID